jgi:uncharacterized membrane protein
MKRLIRILKHLLATRWHVKRLFPQRTMHNLEDAIRSSENWHTGELRFVVEAGLDWPDLLAGTSSRKRAIDIFSQLRIWDTEHNSGVLIYLLLADNKVEILADRGINSHVSQAEWVKICQDMESHFRTGNFESGALTGISSITLLLKQHFPAVTHKINDLPDRPLIL